LPAIKKNLAFPHVLSLLFSDSRYAWDIGDDSDGHTTPTPSLLLTAIHAHLSCIFFQKRLWAGLELEEGGFMTL